MASQASHSTLLSLAATFYIRRFPANDSLDERGLTRERLMEILAETEEGEPREP